MTRPRYSPIKLLGGGPSASEIIIRDRDHDRFSVARQPDERPKQEQPVEEKTESNR